MATKAELEQEVEQLRIQLSAEKPDLAAINTEIDQLKTDLGKAVSERDYNWTKLQEVQTELVDSQTQLQAAGQVVTKSSADLGEALSKVDDLQKQLDAVKSAPAEGCDGNHVSLDGEKYDIIWRSTVRDLSVEGYHKRNVDENQTAIVIAKHGG